LLVTTSTAYINRPTETAVRTVRNEYFGG
jgi:hypothetical protein